MMIEGATRGQIEAAAEAAGVRVVSNSPGRFVIRTIGRRPQWRRIGRGGRTIPGAVCWHGHRAFMRALYKLAPSARFATTLATYESAEHFESTHGFTRYKPGTYYGVGIASAAPCDCERGRQ